MTKRSIRGKYSHGPGEYGLSHNPGYDFMRIVHWLEQAKPDDPNLPFASYCLAPLTLISACCAIEGYINMVGMYIDKKWAQFDKGPVPIKDRIARIYQTVGKKADFSQGVLQKVLDLFKMRVELVHPRYINKTEIRDSEIPDVFHEIGVTYPPEVSRQIAEEAIALILKETDLRHLQNHWREGSYSERIGRKHS